MRWPKHMERMGASQTPLPGCGKRAGSTSSGLHSRLLVGVTSTFEDLLHIFVLWGRPSSASASCSDALLRRHWAVTSDTSAYPAMLYD